MIDGMFNILFENRAWLCYILKVYIWRKRLRCSETTFFKQIENYLFFHKGNNGLRPRYLLSVTAGFVRYTGAKLYWWRDFGQRAIKSYSSRPQNSTWLDLKIAKKVKTFQPKLPTFLKLTIHNINHTYKKVINDFVELSWT